MSIHTLHNSLKIHIRCNTVQTHTYIYEKKLIFYMAARGDRALCILADHKRNQIIFTSSYNISLSITHPQSLATDDICISLIVPPATQNPQANIRQET